MRRRSIGEIGVVILLGVAVATSVGAEGLRDQYKAPFEGPMLKGAFDKGTKFLCISNLAGSTGVYPKAGEHRVISEFMKQSKPATWQMMIDKESAAVVDNQGNEQVMLTTKFNSEGIILVGAGRNESVQVITIDPNNSSFVYTTQNAQVLWNRASTYVGRCDTLTKD